jgi:hypothetical protein
VRVLNVHERELPTCSASAGALIDALSSRSDALWPKRSWPPMKLDAHLGVGAAGGHGPIRYFVEEYKPGQSIWFRFTGPKGFKGHHGFEVAQLGAQSCVLRHTLEMTTHGTAIVSWPLVFRPMHDALIEDGFAQAQASLGFDPFVRQWSFWVKILRSMISRGRSRAQTVPDVVPRTDSAVC